MNNKPKAFVKKNDNLGFYEWRVEKKDRRNKDGKIYFTGTQAGKLEPHEKFLEEFRAIAPGTKWEKIEFTGGNPYTHRADTTQEEAFEILNALYDVVHVDQDVHADAFSNVLGIPEEVFEIMNRYRSNPSEFNGKVRQVPVTKNAEMWMSTVGL